MRKSLRVLGLLISAIALAASTDFACAADDLSQAAREQIAARINAGEAAASCGDWKAARKEFLEVVRLDSQCALGYYDLGVAQAHLGQLSDAASSEQKAITIDPKFSDAFVELGWVLSQLGRIDEAIISEKRALQINPANKAATKNLEAIALARRANRVAILPAAAGSVRSRTIASQPLSPPIAAGNVSVETLLLAAQTSIKEHDFEAARRSYQEVIALQPNNAAAHSGLGVALGNTGNIDGQIAEENKAISLDEKSASAFTNLGWALAKRQRWDEALKAYEKASALDPTCFRAQVGQGLALYFSGKPEAGVAVLRAALAQSPKNAEPHIALGTIHAQQGKAQEAESEFKAALRLAPANIEAKEQLAKLMLQLNRPELAAKQFQDIVNAAPSNANAHGGLSMALEMKGDSKGAEEEARKALGLNPRLQLAQVTLERLAQKKTDITK